MKCGAVLASTLTDVVCQLMSDHSGNHHCRDSHGRSWWWANTPNESEYPAEDRSLG
jgi:hypothetical protein